MAWVNQVVQVTLINLQNVPRRLGTSLVVVIGIAGVVGVLVSVLAMAEGFRHTLASTGRSSRVMMLRAGSDAELSSGVARDQAVVLASLPAVGRDVDGRPLASAEIVVMVDLPRRGQTDPNNVPFRGVQPAAFAIRDELTLIEGRRFERGVREVIEGDVVVTSGQFLLDSESSVRAGLKRMEPAAETPSPPAATCTSPRSGRTPRSRCRRSGGPASSRSPPRWPTSPTPAWPP